MTNITSDMLRAKMRRLTEDVLNEDAGTHIIYLITDRYEHAEFYVLYGKGIYTDMQEALNDYEKELKYFLTSGPDDCHTFSLTECHLNDDELKTLQHFIELYNNDQLEEYDDKWTAFMEKIVRDDGIEIKSWTR